MMNIKKEDIEKSNSWPFLEAKKILKERKNNIPNVIVIIPEVMKVESNSL